ncbi:MAG TPA: ABC transporter ATP-binding protein/permease [Candidatus Limiplasma sp.]|nr:ABC transporter ATP-binding protein/permease [Candidatus Limiplasma sp.]HRX08750.1 ABC transporter ATP-binding protein/permease [Candidatus Limiplasma sp.]
MLQINHISKTYTTGQLSQAALDDVSFNLRDNEFVAILGPSGSGKTTLLNVIGGLDRYDSGNLIINNISTKDYNDRDWDSYRNHTIGFVFQSYNLIQHPSILSNVEIALTISGISKSERRKRAKETLTLVGLGDHLHKRPNQLSGGQMQRVAIARALINNPDILLADEPTGALDSETSTQVLELLREVAKDRLVVLVTHNRELAGQYANRIIQLRDGKITDDSNPFDAEKAALASPKHQNMGKASMSFLTALSLSFNNLRTKIGRTVLTAFAGSIGIIGIALILSLSNGVNNYIDMIQKDTMVAYPITIDAQTIDLSSLIAARREVSDTEITHGLDNVYSNINSLEMASSLTTSIASKNNLTAFKAYLDNPQSEIAQYLGENGVIYSYDIQYDVYARDADGAVVNTDGSTLTTSKSSSGMAGLAQMAGLSGMTGGSSSPSFSGMNVSSVFEELIPGQNGQPVSAAITANYDVLYGDWPKAYDEVVIVLDENNEISAATLYKLGLLPSQQYKELMTKIQQGEEVQLESQAFSYADIAAQTFYLIPASDYYTQNANGLFVRAGESEESLVALLENAIELHIAGIVRRSTDANSAMISGTVGYTAALTETIIRHTDESAVVQAQIASPDINVLNGLPFAPASDTEKAAYAAEYLSGLNISQKAEMSATILRAMYAAAPDQLDGMLSRSETELAGMLDMFLQNPDDAILLKIYDQYITAGSYAENLAAFGVVNRDTPISISIYADSFEDKDAISASITAYNATASQADQITYTDYVGLMMSSVTTIINVISYVLIAFVAVSLIVSSIMIGIITYISVLERTKEIGILRAIGASKKNISQVFSAETFIIGLFAGLLGVGVTYLLLIPGNVIIHALIGSADVNAMLRISSAVILIILSMLLTLISGIIPSRKAAKKDPVAALRTE